MKTTTNDKVLEMGNEFFPDVKIRKSLSRGFKSTGWVVMTVFPWKFLSNMNEWDSVDQNAHIFKNLETAIATCASWQYFSASNEIAVIPVTDEE
jgi:hypothetical protein